MQVEFDQDFLNSNNKDENGALNIEIRKLFAHEVGHGFQLQHAPEERDVMYYDISGDKDFSSYWPRIREFFAPEQ
jgi:predicted Zn-dependent protease